MFEQDYPDILRYAKSLVSKMQLSILPDDIVNDAYVNLYGKDYSKALFFKQIKTIALNEKNQSFIPIGHSHRDYFSKCFDGDHQCKRCKLVKNISQFKIVTKPNGRAWVLRLCNDCAPIVRMEYYYKTKDSEKYKKQNADNFRKYVDKNREKWNAYNRERYRLKKLKNPI